MQKKNIHIRYLIFLVLGLLLINWIGNSVYKRFDLTQDKRYTLSEAASEPLSEAEGSIMVEVLLEGDFPAEFKRLQSETRQILEEFASKNSNVKFVFIDGSEYIKSLEDNLTNLESNFQNKKIEFENKTISEEDWIKEVNYYNHFGRMITELTESLVPAQVSVQEGGRSTQELIYPWAIISHKDQMIKVPLLKNLLGSTGEERITNSIQNLEFAFADAFSRLLKPKRKKVAVLKGNGQLSDRYIADFLSTLKDYYFIAPFTLDSAAIDPVKTLNQLKDYHLIVSAKPTETFTESEKYILDQYTMNGGKSLWLVDMVNVEMDSLFETGSTFAFRNDLGLTDFFFRYGLRVNPVLVNDMYAAPIVLASGTESASQYNQYPWFYYPLSSGANNHPIVNNTESVKFEFANAIDLLDNDISKTILLSSSPLSKIVGTPVEVSLNEIEDNLRVVNQGPEMQKFSAGEIPLAVLLEGEFTSVYNNRIKPFTITDNKNSSRATKMIVISDGDVIKNQFQGNRPLELGFDKWTNTLYGNKEFLLNSVNYLLDDTGLINIRTKEISIAFLDTPRVVNERTKWQVINLLMPIGLLGIFGVIFYYVRRRKYT